MAYLDPDLTNAALAKTGSSYQVPSLQSAPASPPPAAPAQTAPQGAPAPVAQAKDPEVAGSLGDDAPKPSDNSGMVDGLKTAGGMADAMGPATEKPDAMKKLGGLIGTVLSIYSGNEMGAVSGIASMKGGKK